MTVKSVAMQGRADITVYIPQAVRSQSSIPVIVLLHGVYGSHLSWAFRGGVHQVMERSVEAGGTPFVLVMPSDGLWGDGSGYIPHAIQNFEKWIGTEVPSAVRSAINEVDEGSTFYLSGLSMGGYGAFRVGTIYDIYRGISAHSSMTDLAQMNRFAEERWVEKHKEVELSRVTDILERYHDKLVPMRFDCGFKDPLLIYNQVLHDCLKRKGIEHVYEEQLGGHDWNYWHKNISHTFRFFSALENPSP